MSRNFGYSVLGLGGSGGDGGANRSTRKCIQLTINSTTQNYNIYSNRGGCYVAGKSDVTLTVQAIVGSAGTGQYAIDTGNQWTSGDTIKIINNSQIVGAGGEGGNGGQGSPNVGPTFQGQAGAAGGNAINLGFATTIQNNNGNIRGGGGAGGGGGATQSFVQGKGFSRQDGMGGGGGGGGAGQSGGAGGTAGAKSNCGSCGVAGQAGSISGAGNGGQGGPPSASVPGQISAGNGGNGGGFGAAGQAGQAGVGQGPEGGPTGEPSGSGGSGGAAGKAVNLNSNTLTWEDGCSNIQGAVS
tara:strand:+ start:73 stop:966 length:894 start_codon:yes stop_codon:yes gene_type:complete